MGIVPASLSSLGQSVARGQVHTAGQEHILPARFGCCSPTLLFLNKIHQYLKTVLPAALGPDSPSYNVYMRQGPGVLKPETIQNLLFIVVPAFPQKVLSKQTLNEGKDG